MAVADGGELVLGDALVDGDDGSDVEPGMAGNGGTAVSFFAVPLAMTSAITSATTNNTAAPAAIHNQRGGLDGLRGGSPCGGSAGGN